MSVAVDAHIALAQTSPVVQIRRSSFPQGVFSISQADAFDQDDAIFRIDALISGSICERCRTMESSRLLAPLGNNYYR